LYCHRGENKSTVTKSGTDFRFRNQGFGKYIKKNNCLFKKLNKNLTVDGFWG